jgi:hypothetical protein
MTTIFLLPSTHSQYFLFFLFWFSHLLLTKLAFFLFYTISSRGRTAADSRFRYLRAVLSLRKLFLCQKEMVLAQPKCPSLASQRASLLSYLRMQTARGLGSGTGQLPEDGLGRRDEGVGARHRTAAWIAREQTGFCFPG